MRPAMFTRVLRRHSTSAGVPIHVFGHKIPDTDAVCAAMVRAWELQQHGHSAQPFRLGSLNKETEYVLNTFGLDSPSLLEDGDLEQGTPVAVVDTNNPEELPQTIFQANILSIVDHHKLSGLTTSSPIDIDIRPLCSTGSILFSRMKTDGIEPTPEIAGLMLSCILSDSLEFRSPTTTSLDKELANELAAIADVDLHTHATSMLAAKADISHLSPEEILLMDSKIYTIAGKKLRISVVETTNPESVLVQRASLADAMPGMVQEQELDALLLFVVDILQERALYMGSSEHADALVEGGWGLPIPAADSGELLVLEGVLSRKKQIIPALES